MTEEYVRYADWLTLSWGLLLIGGALLAVGTHSLWNAMLVEEVATAGATGFTLDLDTGAFKFATGSTFAGMLVGTVGWMARDVALIVKPETLCLEGTA